MSENERGEIVYKDDHEEEILQADGETVKKVFFFSTFFAQLECRASKSAGKFPRVTEEATRNHPQTLHTLQAAKLFITVSFPGILRHIQYQLRVLIRGPSSADDAKLQIRLTIPISSLGRNCLQRGSAQNKFHVKQD